MIPSRQLHLANKPPRRFRADCPRPHKRLMARGLRISPLAPTPRLPPKPHDRRVAYEAALRDTVLLTEKRLAAVQGDCGYATDGVVVSGWRPTFANLASVMGCSS